MGEAKRQIIANDDYYRIAKKILLEIGEISLCAIHPDEMYFYQTHKYDNNALYGLATDKLKEKYPDMKDFNTFHQQVQQVLTDAAEKNECPICNNDD